MLGGNGCKREYFGLRSCGLFSQLQGNWIPSRNQPFIDSRIDPETEPDNWTELAKPATRDKVQDSEEARHSITLLIHWNHCIFRPRPRCTFLVVVCGWNGLENRFYCMCFKWDRFLSAIKTLLTKLLGNTPSFPDFADRPASIRR